MTYLDIPKNFLVAIIPDRKTVEPKIVTDKLQQLTEYYSNMALYNDIIYADSVDEALQLANKTSYKYCLIQTVGHILTNKKIFHLIDEWVKTIDFFITGHILKKNNYYSLHHQAILVNMEYYRKFNCPVFGELTSTNKEVCVANESSLHIHDDYTPLWLKPVKSTKIVNNLEPGWNFINISLKNNIPVHNFNIAIRQCKQYMYPNDLKRHFDALKINAMSTDKLVFLWNTEVYFDVDAIPKDKYKLTNLVAVASGLKPNYIIKRFPSIQSVHYFDYSKPALTFKKLLVDYWDGEDYVDFTKFLIRKYNFDMVYVGTDITQDWADEKARYPDFVSFWKAYQKLPHTYQHIDLLENPKDITIKTDSLVWISNIFHTLHANFYYSKDDLNKIYTTFRNSLKNCYLLGKDEFNKRVSEYVSNKSN